MHIVTDESAQHTRFTHSAITTQYHLKEVIVVSRDVSHKDQSEDLL